MSPGVQALPRAAIGEFRSPPTREGDATRLRCGGCGGSALLIQGARRYGRLVHSFLLGHELCANAVEITAAR